MPFIIYRPVDYYFVAIYQKAGKMDIGIYDITIIYFNGNYIYSLL